MKTKPIYRAKDSWVLCTCNECGRLNYVEPHGTTAMCGKCQRDTEHTNIPADSRDASGCYLVFQKCLGRTPGDVLTSYACSRYARPGSEYCYAHDPATEPERMARAARASADRRLERKLREGDQEDSHGGLPTAYDY